MRAFTHDVPAPGQRAGSDLAFVAVACVVVAVAALLGATWLKTTLLGLPVGMWIVGAAWGVRWWLRERGGRSRLGESERWAAGGRFGEPPAGTAGARGGPRLAAAGWEGSRPRVAPGAQAGSASAAAAASLATIEQRASDQPATGAGVRGFPAIHVARDVAADALRLSVEAGAISACWLDERISLLGGRAAEIERLVAAWSDRGGGGARPLRIGLDVSSEMRDQIARAPSGAPVEWQSVSLGADPASAVRRLNLDAALAHDGGGYPLLLVTAEAPGLEAAWHDWGIVNPLSHPSALPRRMDPSRLSVREFDWRREEDVAMLRALLDAAAALSRHPCRLTLSDRFRGRRPLLELMQFTGDPCAWQPVGDAMGRVGELLSAADPRSASELARTAARLLTAWLSIAPEAPRRSELATCAERFVGEEPGALLRCAAAHFAAYEDDTGMLCLHRADRALAGAEHVGDADSYLHAEIVNGADSALTVGRAAAGIWFACAVARLDRLDFLRQDIDDDLRDAEWLIGRDQDHLLLRRVARAALAARGVRPAVAAEAA
jgi:hypothetical protein